MLALLVRFRFRAQVRIQLLDRLFDGNHLPRALHDFHQTPALLFGERARLFDAHHVADARAVVLVVRLELIRVLVRPLVNAVALQRLDGNDDRLLHLVADDLPQLLLAAVPALDRLIYRRLICRRVGGWGLFGPPFFPPCLLLGRWAPRAPLPPPAPFA